MPRVSVCVWGRARELGAGTDVTRVPAGWSAERVQEYFRWAARVVSGLRGTSAALEEALQRLFEERGVAA